MSSILNGFLDASMFTKTLSGCESGLVWKGSSEHNMLVLVELN